MKVSRLAVGLGDDVMPLAVVDGRCGWPGLPWRRAACAIRVTPPASLTRRANPASSIFWISVASFCPGAVLKYASIRKFEVWICGFFRSAPLTVRVGPLRCRPSEWSTTG